MYAWTITTHRGNLHQRHDSALDHHVMSCGALAPRFEAFNLSSENHLFKKTRNEKLHLDEHVNCSLYQERPYGASPKREIGTTRAHELGLR